MDLIARPDSRATGEGGLVNLLERDRDEYSLSSIFDMGQGSPRRCSCSLAIEHHQQFGVIKMLKTALSIVASGRE